jgi:hypothetical protein
MCVQCGTDLQPKAAPPPLGLNADRAVAASKVAARAVKLLLTDPVGSIGAAYEAFTPKHAMDVGIAFCAFFILSSLLAIRIIGLQFGGGFFSIGFKEVLKVLLIAAVPAACIIGIFIALQLVTTKQKDIARAIFAGGAVLLPLALFNIAGGILGIGNWDVVSLVALFMICYMILLLYAGIRDVLKVSSPLAALSVPLVLIATWFLTKIILNAVL